MNRIGAATLLAWTTDGQELALLDAREDGEFGASHLFWAIPCGLARKEIRARALLPRLTTRICCVDDGRGNADTLAAWLESIGATDVSVLDGGTKAWAAGGNVLFSGVNVPSKAFGEWVEHHYGTESVDAPDLKAWIDSGRDMVVLDSRTLEEFTRMSIPTGISVPGGELAYRIGDIVPDPKTLVVVNCAGRTRSIMGAESLRRAGIPNKVVALRNGTMGWELAGLRCDRGRTEKFQPGTPKTAALALQRAQAFADHSGVGIIGPLDLTRFEDDPDRTLYVLDVRDPVEFRAGHRPGSRNAPGGQLVQATDTWIGVENARIVLVDDTGVRARMAAAWLRQMGHRDVFVVEGGLDAVKATGTASVAVPELGIPVKRVDVTGLVHLLDSGARTLVLDLGRSVDFRDGHIPGAVWGVRTRLDALRPQLSAARHVVITSPDGMLARLAVAEVGGLTKAEVHVLDGGTDAWHAFGRPLVRDRSTPPDDACIDFYLRPYDRNSGVEEAMNAYLSWEIDLVHEIERDGTVLFGIPGEATPRPDLGIAVGLRRAGRLALDLLLPPRCAACDNPVAVHGQLCATCFGGTNFISAPLCVRCGVPFASEQQGGAEGLCPVCRDHLPVYREARAALRYDEQGRRLILPLKHGDRVELAHILAPMMTRAGAVLLDRADVLIPVPLHRRRLFQRKYNQAAVLAFALSGFNRRPVLPDALMRTRRTAPLDDKSPEERAREVAGSFQVRQSRASRIVGRTVLLIDDVMTSGATANACASALLAAGARAVDVLVAARVPDPRLI